MKKHPLLFNSIFTMAIQIIIYLIKIFEVQIIEPMLQAMGVRSEGILPAYGSSKAHCFQCSLDSGGNCGRYYSFKGLFLDTIIPFDIYLLCDFLS